MMMKKILEQKKSPLKAVCYDIAEQREYTEQDFRITLSYPIRNGWRIFYRSDRFGLIIPLEIESVSADSCLVRIGAGTIVEQNSIRYRLMRLGILSELLTTRVGEEGAYLLPVYSGMLVDFRERPHTVNSDRIYLEQKEWEKISMMNCFGLLQKNRNIFAIVESGDFQCRVNSEYNDKGVNHLYAEFLIRSHHWEMVKCEEKTIRYRDAGETAEYDVFAKYYREWFLSRGVAPLKTRLENNPTLRYSADAMRVKIFMASKLPFVPDGSSPVKVFTTCDEARIILDEMKQAGIEKATITLVGWNLGGHDGAYPTHFPVEPAIGGEEGLKKLIARAKQLGYAIVPHDNATDIYRNSPDFDYEYVARDPGGEPVVAGIWGGGQSYKVCPRVFLQRYGYEFDRIRELGFEGHYYMDAQSTVLWQCHDPRHPADEKEFALALAAITTVPRAIYGAVSIECASAYSVPFIDEVACIHFPVHSDTLRKCPENFLSLNPHPVPFYHIALHGLILHQGNWVHNYKDTAKGLLYEIAFGARPSMEISFRPGANGGFYKESIEKVKDAYRICFHELKLQTELIESLREPAPGIYEVRYSNGTELRINTTDAPYRNLPERSWNKT